MPKLIAYLRVSSSASASNTSLDEQLRRIHQYASAFDCEIVASFSEVKSASGKVERKEFDKALKHMEEKELDGLIVFDIDRYFRETAEGLATFKRYFSDGRHQLLSVNQNINTSTDEGWYMFTIFLANAEYERRKIIRRMTQGKEALEMQGYTGKPHPKFSERIEYVQDGTRTRRKLVTDEHCAFIAETITGLRNQGFGWTEIANYLNEHGFKTKPSKRHPTGCKFDAKQVSRICLQQRVTNARLLSSSR